VIYHQDIALNKVPLDTMNTADAAARELVERSRREVEVVESATGATISNSYRNALPLI